MEAEILNRIMMLNPWHSRPVAFSEFLARQLPARFLPRTLDPRGLENRRKAKLVVGPRQSGKSTFILSLLQAREPGSVLVLNCEESLVRRWASSAAGVLADLASHFPSVDTVFLEEAQHLEGAGLLVKGLIDGRRNLDVLVTGSSSYHLQDSTRESLAGRAERRVLLPFSLAEVAAEVPAASPAAARIARRDLLRRMMVLGGYPAVWTGSEPRRELADLVEAFVIRDASDRFRIRRPEAFRRLLQIAAGQTGQIANLSEWAGLLGVAASTVGEWLGLLEETWILKLVPPFAGGRRRELTGAARVHFYDPGLRNALLGALDEDVGSRADRGALAEGLAFAELAKASPPDWTLHHWRSKAGAEVDLVLAHGDRILGVEVKAGHRGRLPRGSRSFIEVYQPELFVVVAPGDTAVPDQELGRTRVRFLPLEDLVPALAEAWS